MTSEGQNENTSDDEKIAIAIPVPNFKKAKETIIPRYILVRAKSLLQNGRTAFQFWALTQTWRNGGMYTEEIGDISKGEFWMAMKLSRGAPNNATIKHMFDIAKIEYRLLDKSNKPTIDKLIQYPDEPSDISSLGHGYDSRRLGFRRPAWASNLSKDEWNEEDD